MKRNFLSGALATVLFLVCLCEVKAGQPIKLSAQNPNYLEYKGKPCLIISSSEHYGSVYNLDFDYKKHFETLAKDGLNYSRVFMGLWELPEDNIFGLTETPFNAEKGKHISIWESSAEGKYDFNKWNTLYFDRMLAVVAEAAKHDVILEIVLFSSIYMQSAWETCPFYFKNNVNKLDSIGFKKSNTMYNQGLFEFQEKLVRKVVKELNGFDNIIFEIQNEPWSDNMNLQSFASKHIDGVYTAFWQENVELANDISLEWQKNIAAIIVNEESKLPKKHLIAQCIGNYSPVVTHPDPNVSIFNFHYCRPEAASKNLHTNRAMSLDETGFMPHSDFNYRREAWRFIFGGGAIYNNLDYSFIVSKEDGTHPIKESTPGWGGEAFRKQMGVLKSFIQSFGFIDMKPMFDLVAGETNSFNAQVLGQTGRQYALYITHIAQYEIVLKLPNASYNSEWVNPVTGASLQKDVLTAKQGSISVSIPKNYEELALKIFLNKK